MVRSTASKIRPDHAKVNAESSLMNESSQFEVLQVKCVSNKTYRDERRWTGDEGASTTNVSRIGDGAAEGRRQSDGQGGAERGNNEQ